MFKEICKGFHWFIGFFSYSANHQRLPFKPAKHENLPAKSVLLDPCHSLRTVELLNGTFLQISSWVSPFSINSLESAWNNRQPFFPFSAYGRISYPETCLPGNHHTVRRHYKSLTNFKDHCAGQHMCTKSSVVSRSTHTLKDTFGMEVLAECLYFDSVMFSLILYVQNTLCGVHTCSFKLFNVLFKSVTYNMV